MMTGVTVVLGPFSLERMVNAVEKVRQRLLRACAALEAAGVPYAVAGGNAVAVWVSRVDDSAVRNTQDVDILIRRENFEQAKAALEQAGFVYRHAAGLDVFLDGLAAKAREAVHLVFANEKVREHESQVNPDVVESEKARQFRVLTLEALVRIKLTAFRDKDRVHIRDLIDVGLVDATWLERVPGELRERLRGLLENPE
ncbi:MAG: nucleotidyl transferase AbiEii/AbiGii toxin family protein [Tepidisphaerales bacterium]